MKLVAQRGPFLLFRVGDGQGIEAMGRVFDIERNELGDEMRLGSIQAMGYWTEPSLPPLEIEAAVKAANASV